MADIKAYSFEAIDEIEMSSFVTCCIMQCMVSGKVLSSSGGGMEAISPEVYEWLHSADASAAFEKYQSKKDVT